MDENVSKILVLGSEEYILNSDTFVEPWNNCILVGARKKSVSLKSKKEILLLKCMLTNLSFDFEKSGLYCIPSSFVKILECNFTSSHEQNAAVETEGDFNAEHCDFTNSCAGLVCTGQNNAVVDDCSFCNNRRCGLQVRKGGSLSMKGCRVSNNALCGLSMEASKCSVFNCVVHENGDEGIYPENSKSVFIARSNVFDNDSIGLCTINSDVDIRENNVFDNGSWGIFAQNSPRCNIVMNKVFRNKAGGVRVGYQAVGKEFSPCVVEVNKIHDNSGPGLVKRLEMQQPHCTNDVQSNFQARNYFQRVKRQDNEIYNNKENTNASKFISVPYCSNCRKICEPNRCGICFTAGYCNKTCQENHWSKHKKICKVLHKRSSLLITSMERAGYDGMIKRRAEGLEEVGPNFSPPPPRDGRRFVVKVQPILLRAVEKYTFLVYDRSLELYESC